MIYIFEILILLVLLLLSAFFSGAEVALVSLDKLTLRKLVKQKIKGAETLRELKRKPRRMLVTLLIGNNLVNILISSIATAISINFFGSIGIGIAVGIVTFFILIFGEIFPKTYSDLHNVEVAILSAPIILALSKIFYPVILLFEIIPSFLLKYLFGKKPKNKQISEQDLLTLAEMSLEENVIQKREKETIEKVLKFNDISVKEIMIPINKVICVNANLHAKKFIELFDKTGHSRYPVFSGKKSNLIGIVHIKEVLRAVNEDEKTIIGHLMINTIRVDGSEKIDEVLKKLQKSHLHMAFVANKNNRIIGLVTFEDLIEEIFGEIGDEEDILRSFEASGKI
ncbi:MAG: hemolysin family protein [Candidatus Micrarchaeia archaeon]